MAVNNLYNDGQDSKEGYEMTVAEIRAQVEAAKVQAEKRYDKDSGAGAFKALTEYRAKNNAAALADICRVLGD